MKENVDNIDKLTLAIEGLTASSLKCIQGNVSMSEGMIRIEKGTLSLMEAVKCQQGIIEELVKMQERLREEMSACITEMQNVIKERFGEF